MCFGRVSQQKSRHLTAAYAMGIIELLATDQTEAHQYSNRDTLHMYASFLLL